MYQTIGTLKIDILLFLFGQGIATCKPHSIAIPVTPTTAYKSAESGTVVWWARRYMFDFLRIAKQLKACLLTRTAS